MELYGFLQNRIGLIRSEKNPSRDSGDIGHLVLAGFDVLLTIADYDFNIMWRVGSPDTIRHYWCTFGDYPKATEWELQHINEFFLYEIWQNRMVALWCEHREVETAVLKAIGSFFQLDGMSLQGFVLGKIASQSERAAKIPEELTHCKACNERSCITELVCHVSSIEGAEEILKTGEILSAVNARNKSGEELSLESRNVAGDPPDYFEYVMFTFGNCSAGDRLVIERNLGRNPTETELKEQFEPGVRFYFRYSDLVWHPGFRSDGYHYCKIKNRINLEDYLCAVIAPESARAGLLGIVDGSLAGSFFFVDETKYSDIYSWSKNAFIASQHVCNKNKRG